MTEINYEVAAGMSNMNDKEFLEDGLAKVQAMTDNPSYVPGITPTPADVKTKLDTMDTDIKQKEEYQRNIRSLETKIELEKNEISNILVKTWCGKIQEAVGTDKDKIEELAYYAKKGKSSPTPDSGIVPVLLKSDINVSGEHTLYFINSETKKYGLPNGIARMDIYGQTAGTAPANLAELIANGGGYLGEANHGKYVNSIPTGNKGKYEYYIAVYVSKKTKKPFAFSIVYALLIN